MPTPQTGTFRCKAVTVNTKTGAGWFCNFTGGTTDADLIKAVNRTLVDGISGLAVNLTAAETATIQFDIDTTDIILNEGTPDEESLSFAGLPSGFTPTAAELRAFITGNGNGDHVFFRHNILTEGPQIVVTTNSILEAFPYTIPTSMLTIVSNGFGWRCVDTIGGDTVFIGLDINVGVATAAGIYGTYELQSFQYTITPPSGTEVDPGETITLTSDPALGGMNFNNVTISMACGIIVPIVQESNLFVFTIPLGCDNSGPIDLIATGNGFQFTGPVTLGTLTILLANASGIYRLVKDKTTDTLYSGARDGSTFDVKIPNPRFKTGYIDG